MHPIHAALIWWQGRGRACAGQGAAGLHAAAGFFASAEASSLPAPLAAGRGVLWEAIIGAAVFAVAAAAASADWKAASRDATVDATVMLEARSSGSCTAIPA
jgi:hypothetical protein